jgi:hypothetical protein
MVLEDSISSIVPAVIRAVLALPGCPEKHPVFL